MVKLYSLAVLLVFTGAAFAQENQEKQKEKRQPRVDISVFGGNYDLEEIEFDPDFGAVPAVDATVERERLGARFAFGGESARGFFQLFVEELSGEGFPVESFDAFGIGGGVLGAPQVGGGDSELRFLIPYRADLSIVAGEDDPLGVDELVVYAELSAEVGFGLSWKGIRPSAGIQLSSLAGVDILDADTDGDGDDDEFTISGTNIGAFVELYYKHPSFPVYARARAGSGDYDASEIAVGVAW